MSESHLHTAKAEVPLLEVEDLRFRYGTAPVFSDVSFILQHGETLQLSGMSGSGKSTLLRVLARLLLPEHGTIRLDGVSVSELPVPPYRRRVAYLQQLPVIMPGSVRDNLTLSFRYSSDDPPADDHLETWLHDAGLEDIALSQSARECSIGQQQRIALLRLLLMRPALLLLDEPTASLDDTSSRTLLSLLALEQERSGLALLHVSHQEIETGNSALRRAVLQHGTLEVRSS